MVQSQRQWFCLCSCSCRIVLLNIFRVWDEGKRQKHSFCLPSGYKSGIPNYFLELPASLPWVYTELECLYHYKPWYATVPVEVLGRWHEHAPQNPCVSEQLVHITLPHSTQSNLSCLSTVSRRAEVFSPSQLNSLTTKVIHYFNIMTLGLCSVAGLEFEKGSNWMVGDNLKIQQ